MEDRIDDILRAVHDHDIRLTRIEAEQESQNKRMVMEHTRLNEKIDDNHKALHEKIDSVVIEIRGIGDALGAHTKQEDADRRDLLVAARQSANRNLMVLLSVLGAIGWYVVEHVFT